MLIGLKVRHQVAAVVIALDANRILVIGAECRSPVVDARSPEQVALFAKQSYL
jgi:hypothetical protein